MNHKYENIVEMLAKMSEGTLNSRPGNPSNQRNGKGIHVEEHLTPIASERRILNSRAKHFPSKENVKVDYRMNTKIPKTEFPYFSGKGLRERLRKAIKYFQINQVPDELRIGIAKCV